MQLLAPLSPDAALLAVGVVADLAVGDPVYAWHPVRLIGRMLTWMEARLRAPGLDGYGGGILLFVGLATVSLGVVAAVLVAAAMASTAAGVARPRVPPLQPARARRSAASRLADRGRGARRRSAARAPWR